MYVCMYVMYVCVCVCVCVYICIYICPALTANRVKIIGFGICNTGCAVAFICLTYGILISFCSLCPFCSLQVSDRLSVSVRRICCEWLRLYQHQPHVSHSVLVFVAVSS
jgi:hypothetical protein